MQRLLPLLILFWCLGAGCGEPPAPGLPPRTNDLPALPVVSAEARAAHALARLEQGPGDLAGLRVPDVHRRNLELATADLVYYESHATRLLADPARIARITGDFERYGNAWHNIIRLMIAFRAREASLAVAWTRPVLDLPLDEKHGTLRLESVRLLGLVRGDEAGRLLLAFYEQSPADREISLMALVSLAERPALRERAYDLALREGTASLWESAPARVAAGMPEGLVDPAVAGIVAWWAALTAGSGPRMDTMLPHLKTQPWAQARLGVDPAAPPWVESGDGAPMLRYGSVDSHMAYGVGWFSAPMSTAAERPAGVEALTGKLPAAEARCLVASLGFKPYEHAVQADLAREGTDPGLYYAAKHCMMNVDPVSDLETVAKITVELAGDGPWDPTRVRGLQRHVASITACDDPQVWDVLTRVLQDVRPLDVARPVLEQAYDLMFQRENELRARIGAMLREGDADDVGVALHMIRRARDPQYVPLLEAVHDTTNDVGLRRIIRRTLTFIYAAGYGIEPAQYATFVTRYQAWLQESEGELFSALATGLLDFGDAGAEAFAAGLGGPQRALYLRAWPRDRGLVPRVVAEALVAPIDRDTPQPERDHALGLAWASFPAEAAAALEALRRRLPATARDPVEAALERVRHRAPRHGDA